LSPQRALFALCIAIAPIACRNDATSRSGGSGAPRSPICVSLTEREAFTCSGATASRSGDTLRIHLVLGRDTLFANTNGEVAFTYQYLGRLGPHGYHVVEQFGGERPPFFWMVQPRSGLAVAATGMPVISPDSNRFAAATPAWDCAESPDQRLAIWRFADSVPVLEWEIAPLHCADNGTTTGWAALEPIWRSPDTLTFARVEQPSERRHTTLVVRDSHTWHLVDSAR
jgi:hypothetical protein